MKILDADKIEIRIEKQNKTKNSSGVFIEVEKLMRPKQF